MAERISDLDIWHAGPTWPSPGHVRRSRS